MRVKHVQMVIHVLAVLQDLLDYSVNTTAQRAMVTYVMKIPVNAHISVHQTSISDMIGQT